MAKYTVNLAASYDAVLHDFIYPKGDVRHVEADFVECANGAVLFYRDMGMGGGGADPAFIRRELISGFPLAIVLSFQLEK